MFLDREHTFGQTLEEQCLLNNHYMLNNVCKINKDVLAAAEERAGPITESVTQP